MYLPSDSSSVSDCLSAGERESVCCIQALHGLSWVRQLSALLIDVAYWRSVCVATTSTLATTSNTKPGADGPTTFNVGSHSSVLLLLESDCRRQALKAVSLSLSLCISLYTLTITHSHALTITCTCMKKSKELKTKIYSHAHFLIISYYLYL